MALTPLQTGGLNRYDSVSWASRMDMRRRKFITLLGGAATWSLAARAQQGERVRRIGVLLAATSDDLQYQSRLRAFGQRLAQLGWTEGHNLRIDVRWGGGHADLTRQYAAELAALAPDIILASGNATVTPLLQVTRTIPVVFAVVADPVGWATQRPYRGRAETPQASCNSSTD